MKIPSNPIDRQTFYDDLINQCLSSRNDRFAFYQTLRNYFLFGASDKMGAPYNKIGSTIDTLASFLYAPDSVRFSVHCGTSAVVDDIHKAIPLGMEVTDQWRMSSTHLRFGLGVKWSLVYGCMLMKVLWNPRSKAVRTYLVEPHQFGVLREDVIELADQEAYCMCYTITKTELNWMLEGNPRKVDIMRQVGERGRTDGARPFSEGLNRLILGGPIDGVPGSIALAGNSSSVDGGFGGRGGAVQYSYSPKVEADLVDMCDLYVFDDDEGDYQLASIASPGVTIYDRPQSRVGVGGIPHFVAIRPEHNLYDYFWGDSFVARLSWLQDWRTERQQGIRRLMKLQEDPPKSGTGMGGITDEKFAAFYTPGGRLAMNGAGAKVEVHAPDLPQDLFADLDRIDSMFDDTAGLSHVIQGKGESGVRSKGQADLMARLGSSRPKARAAVVEESAGDVATLILRNVQENSPQRFNAKLPDGKLLNFVAEQFTKDFEVKVDAHSSSPIFVEDRKKDADELFKAKAISRRALLEAYDPPHEQALQEELIKLEAKEEEQQKMAMMAQQQKPHGKGH